jgi:hypothetical protein
MRGAILMAAATAASIMTAVATSAAQSSYSYPWCGRTPNTDGNVTSCYFSSYRQCMAMLTALGGYCYYNHAYRRRGSL